MIRTFAWLFGVLILHLAASLQAEQAIILTRAANGNPIYHPLHTATKTIRVNTKDFIVPTNMVVISSSNEVPETFLMAKFQVTEAEYKAFVDATNHRSLPRHWRHGTFPEGRDNHPVPYVSLVDARRYCAWISTNTGWNVVIPTAAQWERAAGGNEPRKFPWGNGSGIEFKGGALVPRMNYNGVITDAWLRTNKNLKVTYTHKQSTHLGESFLLGELKAYDASGRATPFSLSSSGQVRGWLSHDTFTGFIYTDAFHQLNERGGFTTPVGFYPEGASPFGCLDMAGNLWQWTESFVTAKNGLEKGQSVNEIRGGSWYAHLQSCQIRGIGEGRAANGAYNTVGFRIAILLP